MKILVCGGRDYADKDAVFAALDAVHRKNAVTSIIHGGASGADSLAAEWAKARGVESVKFAADWNKHGKKAGPIRNSQMIAEGNPDGVVAFPGGRGTLDMTTQAKRAGITVWRPYK